MIGTGISPLLRNGALRRLLGTRPDLAAAPEELP